MSKEIIKENVVAAPTLFIGVGGTGCNIVKRVAEMCRPGEVENINFVCLTPTSTTFPALPAAAHISTTFRLPTPRPWATIWTTIRTL